jgi:hypothetical protein
MMGSTTLGLHTPGMMRLGVSGTVTAISGNSITVTGHQGFGTTTTPTTYTVNATNAVVFKNNATSTISSIAVGDRIFAVGTVTGTSIVATNIIDGLGSMMGGRERGARDMMGSSTSSFTGNGQPVVAGTISAISGSMLTLTTTSNVIYTVDATNAKILEGQHTIAISNIVVGDTVLVQGTVNGTSVTASTVIDQSAKAQGGDNGQGKNQGLHLGFFAGIGNFFKHLFGF